MKILIIEDEYNLADSNTLISLTDSNININNNITPTFIIDRYDNADIV